MLRHALLQKLYNEKKTTPKSAKSRKSKKFRPDSDEEIPTLVPISHVFDDEIQDLGAHFRIDPSTIQQALEALLKFTTENPKLKNQLFDDDNFPIFVQINAIKTPKQNSQIMRIPLKHSILTPDSEICLIVADVKGIPNKEHEIHLEHYEKLLKQRGVGNIKKIMTFHEFRTEYETFEMKRKLVELYDAFLVDGRVSGKTVAKCGKIFYNKRKIPTAVKLNATKLKEHIDQNLQKTSLYLHSKGDSFVAQIGHSKMEIIEIVENAFYVMKGLDKAFPGGFGNVRSLNLFAHRGIFIPIYTTLKNQNDIILKKKTEKQVLKTESGELSTKLNTRVVVKPTGDVITFRLNDKTDKSRRNGRKGEETSEDVDEEDESESENNESSKKKRKLSLDDAKEMNVEEKSKKEKKQKRKN